jgi:lactate oxidase
MEGAMDSKRREFLSSTAVAATLAATHPLLAQTASTESSAKASPPAGVPAGVPANASSAEYVAPAEVKKIEFNSLRDLDGQAQKVLPPIAFRYISNAAGDQWTRHENELAYKRITITPRYLTGHTDTDTKITLLGATISMPVIVSVMGGHGLAHATAEAGTAQGAHAAGTLFTAGSQSTLSMEQIAQATPGPKWFQIYMPEDPGKAKELLQRAKAAGYRAVVLTIDSVGGAETQAGRRTTFPAIPIGNFPGETSDARPAFKSDMGWDDVAFIQKTSGLPVILKGVLSPEMATLAVEHGCGGIQVSNHGGRSLDDVPATITALPRIAEAVHGRIPIVVDGGIRRGQDVFKALALGANAVGLGRPILYSLALGGWMAVQQTLEQINGELQAAMRHTGLRSVAEISKKSINV